MFENLGFQEIALIAIVFLIFFGPKKIPEVMHGIGRGVREFRRAMDDVKSEISSITTIPPDNTILHRAEPPVQTMPKADPPQQQAAPSAETPGQISHEADPAVHEKQSSTGE
jgi:sec-independent protein translocase protein TatA